MYLNTILRSFIDDEDEIIDFEVLWYGGGTAVLPVICAKNSYTIYVAAPK